MNSGFPNDRPNLGPTSPRPDSSVGPSGSPPGAASAQGRREEMDRFVNQVAARLAAIGDRRPRRRRRWVVALLVVLLVIAAGVVLVWYCWAPASRLLSSSLGRSLRPQGSDGVEPVQVLLDFPERHAQRERSLHRAGPFQERSRVLEQQFGDFVGHFPGSRCSGANHQFRARPDALGSTCTVGASSVVVVSSETREQSPPRSYAHTFATSALWTTVILEHTADGAKQVGSDRPSLRRSAS